MFALDPEQLELHGTAVVEASAGTGKTYTITSLFLRLLLEQELTVDQILVVTYTRAATAELRDRIRKRISLALSVAKDETGEDAFLVRLCQRVAAQHGRAALIERLERALGGVDEAPVLTIHGFCQRVLRDCAFESGSAFEAQLTAHAGPLLDEIADDYFMSELYDTSPLRANVLLKEPAQLRQLAARVGGRDLRLLPDRVEEIAFAHDEWLLLLNTCREVWRKDRPLIVERVRALKGVGANALRFADTADGLLASGDEKELLDKTSFVNFTSSGLRAKAKPGASSGPEHPFFELAERLLERARAFAPAKASIELAFRRRFVDYVASELTRRTRETSVRTFDALLSDLDKALHGPSGTALAERLREKYRAALVDEFQDTDPTQYRIFRRIFAGGSAPLLLIGDPKQAIYGFRGADVAAYLGARGEAGERVYTLDVNWRSDAALIQALNTLYGRVSRPFLLEDIAYQQVRAAQTAERLRTRDARAPLDLAVIEVSDSGADALLRQVARHVASDIAALLTDDASVHDGTRFRPLAASDIAVLCRTNKQAAEVQLALSERGVPSVLSGDASVFDSDDVGQLERALTALAHPGDARALRSFLCSLYGGYDAHQIFALEADDTRWEVQRARFARLHETWLSHGFMQALRGLTAAYQVEHRLLARSDGTRRITNLWHLAELLAEASLSERLGPLGLLRWLALVQRDAALRSELVGDAHELRLESSDDAVTLTTVHKSKGLEYPLVYCPFSWDAAELRKNDKQFLRFHDPAHDNALTLDLGTAAAKEYQVLATREVMEEALRLLYVALTRAKHRVTVVLPSVDKLASSALGYTLLGGGELDALKTQLSGLIASGALRQELGTLGFGARALGLRESGRYVSRASHALTAQARPVRRALDHSYRVASFSALIARERTSFGEAGIDRDAVSAASEPAPERDEARAPSTLALGAFPRGAVAGQLVHEVLEHALFDGSEAELEAVADRLVRARGYEAELTPGLTRGLWSALHTPLDEAGLTLASLGKHARVDEMEFVFPVDSLLTPRLLERVFRAHKAPSALPSYASDLRELGFDALHGYLRGFIDLVFRHQGRFYIVDYKSNWLGPEAEHYGPEPLARAMADHHYYLQYHLYVVALHRYLAQRVPQYDYERHFGGVYYLFLRGMAPAHAARCGVFFDRPPRALLDTLDAALRSASDAEGVAS